MRKLCSHNTILNPKRVYKHVNSSVSVRGRREGGEQFKHAAIRIATWNSPCSSSCSCFALGFSIASQNKKLNSNENLTLKEMR